MDIQDLKTDFNRAFNEVLKSETISLSDFKIVLESIGLPLRTFQWYAKEGFIESPKYEGREGYYDRREAGIVATKLRVIKALRESPGIKLIVIRKLFKKYDKSIEDLLDILQGAIENYPARKIVDGLIKEVRENHLIQEEVIKALIEKEVDLKNFKVTDIADQLEESGIKRGIKGS